MATRFYLNTAITPPVSPAYSATWGQTGEASRVSLTYKPSLSAATALADTTVTVPITTTQNILARQFVSPPLSQGGIISGLLSFVVRVSQAATTNNANLFIELRVCDNGGSTFRGTLYSATTDTAYPTVAATRINGGNAMTAVTAYPGDRLVLEVGTRAVGPTAAGSAVHRFGTNAASDFALTTALTTDLNPWLELAQNIFSGLPNNQQFVRVPDGMSTTERMR